MRKRLRQYPSPDELAEMYAKPHNHTAYGFGHMMRVGVTGAFARTVAAETQTTSMADLSCGDAAIAYRLLPRVMREDMHLGDFAPGYDYTGPMERTINEIPDVDLFICSETLEHLANPDYVLVDIRAKANNLILSTPIGEDDNNNPEHVWGWDQDGIREMLNEAGWQVRAQLDLWMPDTYDYQVWWAS